MTLRSQLADIMLPYNHLLLLFSRHVVSCPENKKHVHACFSCVRALTLIKKRRLEVRKKKNEGGGRAETEEEKTE